jgi:hypothetical protein
VVADINLLPVIQPCPLEMLVIHLEAQGMDQVQPYFSGSAQAGNVSRVGWYFRLVKHYMEVGIVDYSMLDFRNVTGHGDL